jgi:tubulin-specific chaperone A
LDIRQEDGKRFNVRRRSLRSGLVDRPTHFIAGENGVEMVIDSPTWTTYSPELKSAIYTANAKAKGYEGGFNTVPEKTINLENNDEIMMKIIAVLNQNTAVMKDIKDNGLAAYFVKSARNGKEVQDMLDENQKLINKNKH